MKMTKPTKTIVFKVGDKIVFAEDKQKYTIKARDGRWAICTKPLNLRKTVFYTIIDFDTDMRGPNDFIFNPYDYATKEGIHLCMKDLLSGECVLSGRRSIRLDIRTVFVE